SLRRTCAVLVGLLDRTYARIGNEEYVRANRSFGLTTLRRKHVRIEEGRARLSFTAKGGIERFFTIDDPLLVQVLEVALERPGRRLFRYEGAGGEWKDLDSDQVNEFIREATGQAFTAKDFRTWKASALVAGDL